MKIKNLIFDLGGVIATLNPQEAYKRFQQLGILDAPERMGVYGQTGFFRQVETGEISADDFCNALSDEAQRQSNQMNTRKPIIGFSQAQWAWMGYIRDVPQQRLDRLFELKKNYKVFLLSNTNPFIWKWAESCSFSSTGHPITDYFDKCYCSFQLGAYKPSPLIFTTMMEDAQIMPQESVFLDDGPKNVEAAQQVGLQGLLVPENEDWWPALEQLLKADGFNEPYIEGGQI